MYDIIVIGAGIAGTSAAAELAMDARVLLLEAEARPGMHASGRSGTLSQGLIDPVGGDLDVDAVLQGYLRLYRQRGGALLTNSAVTGLSYSLGQWQVALSDRQITAPIIVNAAGAWADEVAALASLKPLGLMPKRRTAILLNAPALADIKDWPMVIDVDEQFYFKPDAGQILLSPADETPSLPCDAQPEELDIAIAMDRFLAVVDLDIKSINHSWAGLRTFAPDKTFVVGFDPIAKGFFWLAGQGGYGVQSSPGMSQLARHLILQSALPTGYERIKASVEAVSPTRFSS